MESDAEPRPNGRQGKAEVFEQFRPWTRHQYATRLVPEKRGGGAVLTLTQPTRRGWIAMISLSAVMFFGMFRYTQSAPAMMWICLGCFVLMMALCSNDVRQWRLTADGFAEVYPFRPWRKREFAAPTRVLIDYYPDGLCGAEYRVILAADRPWPEGFFCVELTESFLHAYMLGGLFSRWFDVPLWLVWVPPENIRDLKNFVMADDDRRPAAEAIDKRIKILCSNSEVEFYADI